MQLVISTFLRDRYINYISVWIPYSAIRAHEVHHPLLHVGKGRSTV
jgi:hypothetical protein